MLRHLFIQDFAIISQLHLDFESGLTVFSGETGAGKSILIDAITLLLGARADTQAIRHKQAYAEISAEFDTTPSIEEWLKKQCLDQDNCLILRRRIDQQGRSRAFINGKPVPLSQLKELGLQLIEIHGQHVHQNLTDAAHQRRILDHFGQLFPLVETTKQAWQAMNQCQQALNFAQQKNHEYALLEEQLNWQLNELQEIAPKADEWAHINAEHTRLAHATQLIETAQNALYLLNQSDQALLTQLNSITHQLHSLTQHDIALQDILASLEPAGIQLKEAVSSLNHYVEKFEFNSEYFAQIEKRLETLHHIARKFKVSPEKLFEHYQSLQAQKIELKNQTDIAQLEKNLAQAKAHYRHVAQQLSKKRHQTANQLSQQVTKLMHELAMQGGEFQIQMHSLEEPHAFGLEHIEFKVRGHAGNYLHSLSKVASGGELARISLALAVITSQAQPTATLIFDEVDTGIGGATAEIVGKLLQQLAQNRQILCVTHLPQVAAHGQHHLQVSKESNNTHLTLATVHPLSADHRVAEIARMLGGIHITETTMQHAQEMLHLAHQQQPTSLQ